MKGGPKLSLRPFLHRALQLHCLLYHSVNIQVIMLFDML